MWSLELGGQWKEKVARLGAALSVGYLLDLTLVLGCLSRATRIERNLFLAVCELDGHLRIISIQGRCQALRVPGSDPIDVGPGEPWAPGWVWVSLWGVPWAPRYPFVISGCSASVDGWCHLFTCGWGTHCVFFPT